MRIGVVLAAVFFLLGRPSVAAVIYVDLAATGTNDGSSWANAYTDLQSALAAAGASDEIWVAKGTYKPTSTTDRSKSFALKNGIGIYGGFAGTETLRSQRDPAANLTTLSGDIGTGVQSDNSYHVVTAGASVTSSAILDGFTITGGNATGAAPDNLGGGLYDAGGSPTLSNLVFKANHADDRGGGMRIDTGGNPSLSECVFQSNSSGVGGGGFSSGSLSIISIRNSVFKGNATGAARGGGIDANSVAAVNCLVVGNDPNGVVLFQGANRLVDCTITQQASGYGFAFVGAGAGAISNSILYGDGAGEVSPFGNSPAVSYTDLQGGGFGPGPGNIDANPLFANAGAGDYRLGAGSPAVDAGNNAAVPVGVTTDIAGLPRFFDDPTVTDTGAGTAPIVDMGAFERVPLTVSNPSGATVCAGTPVMLSVTASGQPTLTYQWRKGGGNLSNGGHVSGATLASLSIDPTATGDSGSYDVVVTDGFGQMKTSGSATVTVNATPAAPAVTVARSIPVGAHGATASVPAHAGSTYSWSISGATLNPPGQNGNQVTFDAGPPGHIVSFQVTETGTGGCVSPAGTAQSFVDFSDVPPSYLFHNAVVTLLYNGITSGCGEGIYCPNLTVKRDQMAVFILRGEHGGSYGPPAPTGTVFSDVSTSTPFAKWIEQFGREGISTGCAGGSPPPYCPSLDVTRDAMAKFLLLGKNGPTFQPPAATGTVFADVQTNTFLAKWMEELSHESITTGCGGGNYCPTGTVTRGEMAKFIVRTFGLP